MKREFRSFPYGSFKYQYRYSYFYPIFRIGALGAGDIKLFSVIAGFLTLKTWWVCVEAAFLVGAAMGLFKLLFKNYVKDAHTIHFSVPILAGYLYYLGVVR